MDQKVIDEKTAWGKMSCTQMTRKVMIKYDFYLCQSYSSVLSAFQSIKATLTCSSGFSGAIWK